MQEPWRGRLLTGGPVLVTALTSLFMWLPQSVRWWTLLPLIVCSVLTVYALGYDNALLDQGIKTWHLRTHGPTKTVQSDDTM